MKLPCLFCGRRVEKVAAHVANVHFRARFPCPNVNCTKTFHSRHEAERHAAGAHGWRDKRRLYTCFMCHFSEKTSKALQRHVCSAHFDVRPFKCKDCGRKFKRQYALARHRSIYHERGAEFKCPHCKEKFASWSRRDRHMRRAHTHIRRYVCRKCGNGFFSVSEVRAHQHFCSGVNAPARQKTREIWTGSILDEEGIAHEEQFTITLDCGTGKMARPDFMLSDYIADGMVFVECDENEHRRLSPDAEADRMLQIDQALKLSESDALRVVFVRFNPDPAYPGQAKEERRDRLVRALKDLRENPPRALFSVRYVNYSDQYLAERLPDAIRPFSSASGCASLCQTCT